MHATDQRFTEERHCSQPEMAASCRKTSSPFRSAAEKSKQKMKMKMHRFASDLFILSGLAGSFLRLIHFGYGPRRKSKSKKQDMCASEARSKCAGSGAVELPRRSCPRIFPCIFLGFCFSEPQCWFLFFVSKLFA